MANKVGDPTKRQPYQPNKNCILYQNVSRVKLTTVWQKSTTATTKRVKADNNTPRVDIDGRLYTPQEISAIILQKMKKTAEEYLGQEVTDAVITVLLTSTTLNVRPPKNAAKLQVWT